MLKRNAVGGLVASVSVLAFGGAMSVQFLAVCKPDVPVEAILLSYLMTVAAAYVMASLLASKDPDNCCEDAYNIERFLDSLEDRVPRKYDESITGVRWLAQLKMQLLQRT